jgi:cytochrome c oxidase cbb3-type subunit I/II
MSEGSVMPAYPFLIEQSIDTASTAAKINAMRSLGVPYEKGFESQANTDLMVQANTVKISLKTEGIEVPADREVIALIAYIQRLGKDITNNKTPTTNK